MTVLPLRQRPTWTLLLAHQKAIQGQHLRDLFANEPERGERLCAFLCSKRSAVITGAVIHVDRGLFMFG